MRMYRQTGNTVKIFGVIDARAFILFSPLMIVKSMVLLYIAFAGLAFFLVLQYKFKISFETATRRMLDMISGKIKVAVRYK